MVLTKQVFMLLISASFMQLTSLMFLSCLWDISMSTWKCTIVKIMCTAFMSSIWINAFLGSLKSSLRFIRNAYFNGKLFLIAWTATMGFTMLFSNNITNVFLHCRDRSVTTMFLINFSPKTFQPRSVHPSYDNYEDETKYTEPSTTIESKQSKSTDIRKTSKPTVIKQKSTKLLTTKLTTDKIKTTKLTKIKPKTTKPKITKITTVKGQKTESEINDLTTTMKKTSTKPTTMKKTSTKPTTMKKTSTKPTTMKKTSTKPMTTKPMITKPMITKPTTMKSKTTNPTKIKSTTKKNKVKTTIKITSTTWNKTIDKELCRCDVNKYHRLNNLNEINQKFKVKHMIGFKIRIDGNLYLVLITPLLILVLQLYGLFKLNGYKVELENDLLCLCRRHKPRLS